MNETTTERNILNAVEVLRHVHRETDTLIAELDDALGPKGWRSLNKKWLGLWKTGAQSGAPEGWLATVLHRFYANDAVPRKLILVAVHLKPSGGDPPVIAMAALSLDPNSTAMDLHAEEWDKWRMAAESGPWFTAAAGSTVDLEPEAMRQVVSKAVRGCGRLVPLCSVNKANLGELVVRPVLELVDRVPLKSATAGAGGDFA